MTLCRKSSFWFTLLIAVLLNCNLAVAQTKPVTAGKVESLKLEGETLEKKPFVLSALKNKVVLVVFWSTGCPVCRDKMPELRENVKGWAGKPFELVLVSVDNNMIAIDDYYRYLNQIVTSKERFTQLWAGSASYKDSISAKKLGNKQLPASYLIDKNGKVVSVYSGRIPAKVWDEIAELL